MATAETVQAAQIFIALNRMFSLEFTLRPFSLAISVTAVPSNKTTRKRKGIATMANTNWVTAKIRQHQANLKTKSIQDELALQNEKRFKSLLTRWLDETFEPELRELLNAFNNQSGKMHGPQLNRTPSGFELMAHGLPDYEIIVDGDGHIITYGFARQQTTSIDLIAGLDNILSAEGSPIAIQVLEPYLDEALEKMT